MSPRMSSGSASSASLTSRSKSATSSSLIVPILGRRGCLGEHSALPERVLERFRHWGVVRGRVGVAELLLRLRLRLLELLLLARLELEPGFGEEPVGDPGQVSRAGGVALDQA